MQWFHGRRVLVPFDFSEPSLEAVKVGSALASKPEELYVVHVLIQVPATEPAALWDEFHDEKRIATARESIAEKLSEAGVEGAQINVTIGNPSTDIADLAEEITAGLIVIPSHGYTGVKRLLLGSVAERVVRLAKCPVLVLKEA